jgi:hypothetical protein
MVPQKHTDSCARPDTLTIPELEQSKAAVLNTLPSLLALLALGIRARRRGSAADELGHVRVQALREGVSIGQGQRKIGARLLDLTL